MSNVKFQLIHPVHVACLHQNLEVAIMYQLLYTRVILDFTLSVRYKNV